MKRKSKKNGVVKEPVRRLELRHLTCEQLYDRILKPESATDCAHLKRLRQWFSSPARLALLKLCGSAAARGWRSHIRRAGRLAALPKVRLVIGGGMPRGVGAVRWDAGLVELGKANGITVHRMGKYAYLLAKEEPTATEAILAGGGDEQAKTLPEPQRHLLPPRGAARQPDDLFPPTQD